MSTTLLPPGKCPFGAYLLPYPAMNGPLPAELKFRENSVNTYSKMNLYFKTLLRNVKRSTFV